ncbi:MAG: helix-turn-helix domain-containing protein [Eubacteriales bacterium]|nr:helix-turn-helix domain-containing protein [Eubacteriales bacterium]
MEIIERISQTLKERNKMAVDLCKALDIQTSTMSTWKARKNDPPARYMPTIANFLGVSLEYLLTGKEAPAVQKTTSTEDELLELFRTLPPDRQQRYLGRLENEVESYTKERKYLDEGKRLSI